VHGVLIGLSPKGEIVEFNIEAEKLLGLSRREAIGCKYVDLFIEETSRSQVEAEMQEFLQLKVPCKYTNKLKAADGKTLEIVWSVYTISDNEGMLIGFILL
jgi:PAS domain S-box-containing protein